MVRSGRQKMGRLLQLSESVFLSPGWDERTCRQRTVSDSSIRVLALWETGLDQLKDLDRRRSVGRFVGDAAAVPAVCLPGVRMVFG